MTTDLVAESYSPTRGLPDFFKAVAVSSAEIVNGIV